MSPRAAAWVGLVFALFASAAPAEAEAAPRRTRSRSRITALSAKKRKWMKRRKLAKPKVVPAPQNTPSLDPPISFREDSLSSGEPDAATSSENTSESESPGAPTSEDGSEESSSSVDYEVHGSLALMGMTSWVNANAGLTGLLPSSNRLRGYAEAGFQGAVRFSERAGLVLDASVLVSSTEPTFLALLHEAYAEAQPVGPFYVRIGRSRLNWGSGLAVNPTDLINPPKNPLSFLAQRTGSFLLPLVDVPFEGFTFSAFVSPALTTTPNALPKWLDWASSVAGTRAYALVGTVDVSLMYFHEFARRRHHFGLSVSTVVLDALELHAEGLAHPGRADTPGIPTFDVCGESPEPFSKVAGGSAVVGGRWDASDQSFLSLEYFFNGRGYAPDDFERFVDQLPCLRAIAAVYPPSSDNPVVRPIDPAFVLLRQHYLMAVYRRPRLASGFLEDVSVQAQLLVSLVDASLVAQVRAEYELLEHLEVGLSWAGWLSPGRGEFGLSPTRGHVAVDVRVGF